MVTPPRRVYRDRMLTWAVRLAQLRGALAAGWSGRAVGVGEGPTRHGGSPPPADSPAQVFAPRQSSVKFSFFKSILPIPLFNSLFAYSDPVFAVSGCISIPRQIAGGIHG